MEGSGYWVILALIYLLSMWAKKRRQAERRRQLDLEDDGTIEPRDPRPAQPQFLSNLLRDAGFDFAEEPKAEIAEEYSEPVVEPAPDTIRERMADFDQEPDTFEASEESYSPVHLEMQRQSEIAYAIPTTSRSKLIPDLDDLDDLREAIILKEILDKPRALRRRIR